MSDQFGEAGNALYAAYSEFEMGEHERLLLTEACHVADMCSDLESIIGRSPMTPSGHVKNAVVELRLERTLLTRMLRALNVEDEGDE